MLRLVPGRRSSSSTTVSSSSSNLKSLQEYVGDLPITTTLHIQDTTQNPKIPVFRILDVHGIPLSDAHVPNLDIELAQRMYKTMIREQTVDDIFYNAQRQGRISFYMQNTGMVILYITNIL